MNKGKTKAVVIGAGLGGISAAISLAQEGFRVEVFEKNGRIGGKLNQLRAGGYTFDLGPSILTLPHIFRRLFERSGRDMDDYFTIRPLRPHWRNFFPGGEVIDLYPEREKMDRELAAIGADPDGFHAFLKYSGDLFDLIERGYFERGLDTPADFRRFYGLRNFRGFDLLRTMHGGVSRFVNHPRLRDVLDFFIKYVGSSAYDAPAFMNCLPTIQFRHDLWYVDGGLYNIALGLERLLGELEVAVHLNREVTRIEAEGGRVRGVELEGGERVPADVVVSNMEVVPAVKKLLGAPRRELRRLRRFEPSCSGLVIDLGLDTSYPQLAHHNFFFSGDQREHFNSVFRKKELPRDPTVYLVAASKTDPTVAPPGCDCLKILPHIPYIDAKKPVPPEDYHSLKKVILEKLERMGLKDLRKHIVFEHFWTPLDIRSRYYSNRGSIYGVVADRWKNFGFKAPKRSSLYPNLFFTGGSVNPGGGMPMVVLCGRNVARAVLEGAGEER